MRPLATILAAVLLASAAAIVVSAQTVESARQEPVIDRQAVKQLKKLNRALDSQNATLDGLAGETHDIGERIGFSEFSPGLRGELRSQLAPMNRNIYSLCQNTDGPYSCVFP